MLRKIRIIMAAVCFTLVTLLFLDFTGTLHTYVGWIADLQLLPALLALNIAVIAFLAVLTFILGRVYCSIVCPLGVLQDIISWFGSRRRSRRHRFSYSPPHVLLRRSAFAIYAAAVVCGISPLVVLIAPYSTFGRLVSSTLSPLCQWVNNLLATVAERHDSYAFHATEVVLPELPVLIVTVVTITVIFVMAWRTGRLWCNTICPVGTLLSLVARHSVMRPIIDKGKCRNCGLCSRSCKSSCIDLKSHSIDLSRCISCMDCLDACKHDALHYSRVRHDDAAKPADASRRSFLTASVLAVASAAEAQEKKVDGGLALILEKRNPERNTYILPPGAKSQRHFTKHCTACQLCVSVCPNHVLRPSADITRLMQPEMSYTRGYCRPECTRCSDVCPTGAIRLTDMAVKSSTQIGHAVPLYDNCVVVTDRVSCGNCARHCPTGAVIMVAENADDPDSLKVPFVNIERCIGCGACENLCPARPLSAIYVEGHEVQRLI